MDSDSNQEGTPCSATNMAATTAARQLTRFSAAPKLAGASQPASLVHRRGLAGGGGDHHGPPKVNFWQDPFNPSKWKKEQFVIVSLAGWGAAIYGGYKYFTRDKKEEKKDENAPSQ